MISAMLSFLRQHSPFSLFSSSKASERRGGATGDYERLLTELDQQVHRLLVRMAESRLRERFIVVRWLGYGSLGYVAFLAYVFAVLGSPASKWHVMTIVAFPFCLYYVKSTVNWFFGKRQAMLDVQLQALRAKQRLKLEELKERSDYYRTQKLLERFEQRAAHEQDEEEELVAEVKEKPKASTVTNVHASRPAPETTLVRPRGWLDRWTDYVLGEEEATVRYALICAQCFAHNGLSLVAACPFSCRVCGHVNNVVSEHINPKNPKQGVIGKAALLMSPDADATPLAEPPMRNRRSKKVVN